MTPRVVSTSKPLSGAKLPPGATYVKTASGGRYVYHVSGTHRYFVVHQTSAGWVTVELEGGCGC